MKCFNVIATKSSQATHENEPINLSYPTGCSQRVMCATFPRYARRHLVNNALWRCGKSATFANTRTMRFPAATRTFLNATIACIIQSIFHCNCNQIVTAELRYCKYKGLASARETTPYRCRCVTPAATTTTSVFTGKARSLLYLTASLGCAVLKFGAPCSVS